MSKLEPTDEPTQPVTFTELVVSPTTARDEIRALGRIAAILDTVDPTTQDRIAAWVYDRYRAPVEEVREG